MTFENRLNYFFLRNIWKNYRLAYLRMYEVSENGKMITVIVSLRRIQRAIVCLFLPRQSADFYPLMKNRLTLVDALVPPRTFVFKVV